MSFEKEFEQDGVSDKFYHYLWASNDYFKEDVAKLKLNIPDTVIFENKQPIFWYYSDSNGFIRKKKSENLFLDNIYEKFSQKSSKTNIVGYFIYKSLYVSNKLARKAKIEYFDQENFERFLYKNTSFPSGILQKFIDPLEDHNSKSEIIIIISWVFFKKGCLQAVFSDNVCFFSKRVNYNKIFNNKMDIYERVCTYDGPDYLSGESKNINI